MSVVQMLVRAMIAAMLSVAFSTAPALAQSSQIPSNIQAALDSGDIDAAGSLIADGLKSGTLSSAVMEQVAAGDPEMAGAVLNVVIRDVATALPTSQAAALVTSLTADTLDGVSRAVQSGGSDPNAPTVQQYAENIATNVRQAIAVVAANDPATQQTLLSAAQTGVTQSDVAGSVAASNTTSGSGSGASGGGGSQQSSVDASEVNQLLTILTQQLSATLTAAEVVTYTTVNSDPVVLSTTHQTGSQQNNAGGNQQTANNNQNNSQNSNQNNNQNSQNNQNQNNGNPSDNNNNNSNLPSSENPNTDAASSSRP